MSDGLPSADVMASCRAASPHSLSREWIRGSPRGGEWPIGLHVVLATSKSLAHTLRTLWSSVPVSAFMQNSVPLLSMTDTLEKAKAVLDSSARCAVVLDNLRQPANIVTRSNLIRFPARRSFLLTTTKRFKRSTVSKEPDILEIIDHHRVGDISTFRPIYFRNEPVGSTCTIVAELCTENGVFVPARVAGILLSGFSRIR